MRMKGSETALEAQGSVSITNKQVVRKDEREKRGDFCNGLQSKKRSVEGQGECSLMVERSFVAREA